MKHFFLLCLSLLTLSLQAQPLLVGHRGSSYGVENAEEAYRNGAKLGYQYVETDIKVTKDTKFVLCHDDNLGRWGHDNLVIANSTLAELQAVTMTQTRGGVTYTAKLLELGEFLDLCTELNVLPVIELKWGTGVNSNDQSNMPQLVQVIKDKGYYHKAIILTSMKPCLEWLHTNHPEIQLQLLISSNPAGHLEWCKQHNADIDIESSVCNEAAVDMYHEAGLKVNMWTTNTETGYKNYASMGCNFITTDNLDGNNLPTFDPKVTLPAITSDYPDVLEGTTVSPSAEFIFREAYIEKPISAIEEKSLRRILAHDNLVYVLALDASAAPTIIVIDPITQAITEVSTAGLTMPAVIEKGKAERLLSCSDIQVTQDGYLVASNLAETTAEKGGEVTFYKWEKDANGLPTGDPIAWFTTQANAELQNTYAGETFAYSGTSTRGIIYMSIEAANTTGNIRIAAIPMLSEVPTPRTFTHTLPPARGFLTYKKMGADYRFTISPATSNHILVTGSGSGTNLASFAFVKKESTSAIEIPDALGIPTTLNHIGCFRLANTAYAVLPGESLSILEINDPSKANIVATTNTALTATAAVAFTSAAKDESGNITHGDIDIFSLKGELASLLTTRSIVDGLNDVTIDNSAVVYYNIMGNQVKEEQLSTGVYIRRQGKNATKIFIP